MASDARRAAASLVPGLVFSLAAGLLDSLDRLFLARRLRAPAHAGATTSLVAAALLLAACWLPHLLALLWAQRSAASRRGARPGGSGSGLALVRTVGGLLVAATVLVGVHHHLTETWRWGGVVAYAVLAIGAGGLARVLARNNGPTAARTVAIGLVCGLALALAAASAFGYRRLVTLAASPRQADDARPVVLITVDTLRADRVPCYGGVIAAPALDRLCRESVVFERAYSSSSWTLPALASLMSGLTPLDHGVLDTRTLTLQPAIVTLAQRLHAAGYRTLAVVHNEFLDQLGRGFDRYQQFPPEPTTFGDALQWTVLPAFGTSAPSSAALSRSAIDTLRAQPDGRFFLWLHYLDPHGPYEPTLRPTTRVPPPGLSWRFDYEDDHDAVGRRLGPEQRRWVEQLYDLEAQEVDAGIGAVVDALKNAGLYERTLLVFASDHGEEFWDHGGFEHGHTFFDELIHVPLLVKLPHETRRGRVARPVSTRSLYATILDASGLQAEDARVGSSLRRLWEAPDARVELPPLVAAGLLYGPPERVAFLFEGFKYVVDRRRGTELLFDLLQDPQERRDLAPAHPDALERLRSIAAGQTPHRPTGERGEAWQPSAETLARLRALGYVGAASPQAP